MPLDHIGFAVADFPKSRAFYLAALAPLGFVVRKEGEGWALLGHPDDLEPPFWFGATDVAGPAPGQIHLAFTAADRAQVQAFHAAALAAGARDNGGPGIRAQYGPHYYAAFVIDPDGHNLEAVCHGAEP